MKFHNCSHTNSQSHTTVLYPISGYFQVSTKLFLYSCLSKPYLKKLLHIFRSGNEEAVRLLLARSDIDVNFQSKCCILLNFYKSWYLKEFFNSFIFFYFSGRHGENALIEAVTYRRYDIAKTLGKVMYNLNWNSSFDSFWGISKV